MVAHSQYQAYALATRTVAKTRQVVMLYDGTIRFLQQAKSAIESKRIEERFRLLQRASEVIVGLQSSIDFDTGGEVAQTLHRFYSNVSMRIMAINFKQTEGIQDCNELIAEIKQMRDVWDSIDKTLNKPTEEAAVEQSKGLAAADNAAKVPEKTVSLSA